MDRSILKDYVRLCKRGNYQLINDILNDENLTTNIHLVSAKYNVPLNEIQSIIELKKSEHLLGCGFNNGPEYMFDLYNYVIGGGKGGRGGKTKRPPKAKQQKAKKPKKPKKHKKEKDGEDDETDTLSSDHTHHPETLAMAKKFHGAKKKLSSTSHAPTQSGHQMHNKKSEHRHPGHVHQEHNVTVHDISDKLEKSKERDEFMEMQSDELNNFKRLIYDKFKALQSHIKTLNDNLGTLSDSDRRIIGQLDEIKSVFKKLGHQEQYGGNICKCACVDSYAEFMSSDSESDNQMTKCGSG